MMPCLKDRRYPTFTNLFCIALLYYFQSSDISFQVKFDQFVEQGRVLHNYASILELLLRLRQCCDHPFLVMRLFHVRLCFL